jgi:uncharacterized Zn ribbon protein
MANAKEKEALGLSPDASEEDVINRIAALQVEPEDDGEDGEGLDYSQLTESLGLADDASAEDVLAAVETLKGDKGDGFAAPLAGSDGLQSLAEALNAQVPDGTTAKRKIRHKAFSYRVLIDSPVDPNKKVYAEKLARRGETVDLLADDIERGEKFGAFETAATQAEDAVKELDAADLSDGDLIRLIKDRGLNVNQTIALSKGDPVQAKRLIDAENSATGNDPRITVIEGLTAVINRTQ